MIFKRYYKVAIALIALSIVPFIFTQEPAFARPPLDATPVSSDFKNAKTLKDPCARDPQNLIRNGIMAPSHDTQYGSLAENWNPFIFDGTPPQFRWVGNEQIDPEGSQQIFSNNTFDAGIYQTVGGLQPGAYYWFRLGYSLAAKSYSGPNVRVNSIGRKVGVDPFGGTDPKSPNVIWGPDYFDGNAAVNILEMILVFPARATNATLFIRAMARDGSSGENRVWLDAVCMEARPELGSAPPLAPTATPVPPTNTPRPVVVRAPSTPTRIAQAPTNTPLPTQVRAPETATPTQPPPPTATPRFARPDVTPSSGGSLDLGLGVVAVIGLLLVGGAIVFFGVGIFWWMRMR